MLHAFLALMFLFLFTGCATENIDAPVYDLAPPVTRSIQNTNPAVIRPIKTTLKSDDNNFKENMPIPQNSGLSWTPVASNQASTENLNQPTGITQPTKIMQSVNLRQSVNHGQSANFNQSKKISQPGNRIQPTNLNQSQKASQPIRSSQPTKLSSPAKINQSVKILQPQEEHPLPTTMSYWTWPLRKGRVVGPYSPLNKGINIAGSEGECVYPSAPGTVVYSGDALKAYGNLIIIKHSNEFLSTYAYNAKILTKEGEKVQRNQCIAKIGPTRSKLAILHFEVRKNGRPIDPLSYLSRK